MIQPNTTPAVRQVFGVIRHVDTINRELHVRIDDAVSIVDVPLDCPIFLHGERVKLRLLQPLDRVRVTCKTGDNLLVARVIEVQPE